MQIRSLLTGAGCGNCAGTSRAASMAAGTHSHPDPKLWRPCCNELFQPFSCLVVLNQIDDFYTPQSLGKKEQSLQR